METWKPGDGCGHARRPREIELHHDCPVVAKNGREYYQPQNVPQEFPLSHGGTAYGYGKCRVVPTSSGKGVVEMSKTLGKLEPFVQTCVNCNHCRFSSGRESVYCEHPVSTAAGKVGWYKLAAGIPDWCERKGQGAHRPAAERTAGTEGSMIAYNHPLCKSVRGIQTVAFRLTPFIAAICLLRSQEKWAIWCVVIWVIIRTGMLTIKKPKEG